MVQVKIKRLPPDVYAEAMAFVGPYLELAERDTDAEHKRLMQESAEYAASGEAAIRQGMVVFYTERLFTRAIGEMIQLNRSLRMEIKNLKAKAR